MTCWCSPEISGLYVIVHEIYCTINGREVVLTARWCHELNLTSPIGGLSIGFSFSVCLTFLVSFTGYTILKTDRKLFRPHGGVADKILIVIWWTDHGFLPLVRAFFLAIWNRLTVINVLLLVHYSDHSIPPTGGAGHVKKITSPVDSQPFCIGVSLAVFFYLSLSLQKLYSCTFAATRFGCVFALLGSFLEILTPRCPQHTIFFFPGVCALPRRTFWPISRCSAPGFCWDLYEND
jgi:hypothetical protein